MLRAAILCLCVAGAASYAPAPVRMGLQLPRAGEVAAGCAAASIAAGLCAMPAPAFALPDLRDPDELAAERDAAVAAKVAAKQRVLAVKEQQAAAAKAKAAEREAAKRADLAAVAAANKAKAEAAKAIVTARDADKKPFDPKDYNIELPDVPKVEIPKLAAPVSYTHLTLPTICSV